MDTPSFLTVGRISRSNLSWGGYYCDVYIKREPLVPLRDKNASIVVPVSALLTA